MLRTYGWMPCWRIVFSTFSRCMSFHTAWVIHGLTSSRKNPPLSAVAPIADIRPLDSPLRRSGQCLQLVRETSLGPKSENSSEFHPTIQSSFSKREFRSSNPAWSANQSGLQFITARIVETPPVGGHFPLMRFLSGIPNGEIMGRIRR